jgi:hypothetical protein
MLRSCGKTTAAPTATSMELSNWINDGLYVSQCSCDNITAYHRRRSVAKKRMKRKST